MIRATSLKRRIVVQFLALLLPLLSLLAVQIASEWRRNESVRAQAEIHSQAGSLRDAYRGFVDGAADAVDSGALTHSRLGKLREAAGYAHTLAPLDGGLAQRLDRLHDAIASDLGIANLERSREAIAQTRREVESIYLSTDAALERTINESLQQSARISGTVALGALILLAVAALFVRQMIRGLTEPLEVAVRVAQRIGSGERVAAEDFRARADIDQLLASLLRMSVSLDHYRDESARHRRILEEKVAQLDRSRQSLAEAQRLAQLGNWSWAVDDALPQWSDEMFGVLGIARDARPGWRRLLRAFAPEQRAELRAELARLRAAPRRFTLEQRIESRGGGARIVVHQGGSEADASGRVVRLFGSVQDISDRKRAEDQIRRLALFDSLTRLPNRRCFKEHVRHAIERAQRSRGALAVMFIDLDRFKQINDTLGHGVGDELLREVADRLRACVRASDAIGRDSVWADDLDDAAPDTGHVVARLGGDEFTVLLANMPQEADVGRVARRIAAQIAEPISIAGYELFVTASIGIAQFPDHGADVDHLLRHADAAMYEAKRLGKNQFRFFTEELHAASFEKLTLEKELRRAIERDQLVLHYQPKVDAQTLAINGVEALIRWQHPEWGLVPPSRFIPVAEEAGLIVAIGDWVLSAACRQVAAWRDAGLPPVTVAVNLASPSFRVPNLARQIGAELARWRLSPASLVIEVTESLLMHDVEAAIAVLHELRALGVRLAIDDFGTGYSSLSYLMRFPIDQLKVDQSFVRHLEQSREHAAIAKAVISLGRALEIETVAEGVETAAQAARLIAMRCSTLQGYWFARPMPPDGVTQLLRLPAPFAERSAAMRAAAAPQVMDTVI
jgi:predicted signal transduction protein with EAL and GGDEF domain